jgi:hypothetical protein
VICAAQFRVTLIVSTMQFYREVQECGKLTEVIKNPAMLVGANRVGLSGGSRWQIDEALRRAKSMANESTTQRMYDTLRGQVSARLVRALDATEEDLANLSLGELINTLFLIHGDGGSTGNFGVSFGAALKIVGRTMMWRVPEPMPTMVEPGQRVN